MGFNVDIQNILFVLEDRWTAPWISF